MSDKIKVMTVFGTRPEAVKMCPVVKAIEKNEQLESIVCVTAQHRQMLDQVLSMFGVVPDYDLDIMKDRQTLSDITARVLDGLNKVFEDARPDIVLVHGDTTTTFVAALSAFYHKIAVGHVEAGLRTFDKYFPYPEEMNRKMAGVISDIHFSPTQNNKRNLLNENISEDIIFVTGNTVIDALKDTYRDIYSFEEEELRKLDFENKRVIAVTAHRRENLGGPLENICRALKRIAAEYRDTEIVYPVHMNPVVRDTVNSVIGGIDNIKLIKPVGVADMHNLIGRSYIVATDSGGLQEEAPSLGVPVLVLRNETERPEAVDAGTVKLIGCKEEDVYSNLKRLLDDKEAHNKITGSQNPYGDGNASERIVEALLYYFKKSDVRPDEF